MTDPVQYVHPDDGFKCLRCGECCRWKGIVRISVDETEKIADFLRLGLYEFTQKYTALLPDRSGLTLIERENGECIFLKNDPCACAIEPVKPKQCRDFPFRWAFPGWEKLCAAGKHMKTEKQ